MASNRLFLLDPETNEAVCIAKGYSNGWVTGISHVDDFLEEHQEFTGDIDKTRFRLITEGEIPKDAKIHWKE